MPEHREEILILDFGSQYSQLIARRVRECKVFSRIVPHTIAAAAAAASKPIGIILSGGPASVLAPGAPACDPGVFALGVPVLGICYGLQLMAKTLGAEVVSGAAGEYGHAEIEIVDDGGIFDDSCASMKVWMSHGDKVASLPEGFRLLARSPHSEHAAIADTSRRLYGLQFHPEVVHTPGGMAILERFCRRVCAAKEEWTMGGYIEEAVASIRETVGGKRVILGLSGGVDSSVAAALIAKAIGHRLTCIFVDNGLLRKGEPARVDELFQRNFDIEYIRVDASARFLDKLSGESDPERKRKIIGHEFVEVFNEAAARVEGAEFLAQGTTYPDVIESVPIGGNPSALIKSHHNVGGLPERMRLKLLEPLRCLFKDEVRKLGFALGLPEEVVLRQPFPGPGLAVRLLGPVSKPDLDILREADAIVVQEMKRAGLYYSTWQAFAVLLPVRTVGVMGDERTYDKVVAIRAVESQDGMTADWVRLPYDLLARMSSRIVNEVDGVNRVVFDLTSKPPGTIEWE